MSSVSFVPAVPVLPSQLMPRPDNHKPTQTSDSRTTKLTSSNKTYNLTLEDKDSSGVKDIFTFTGQKSAPRKSYVLVFDASSQQATLEPLSSSYTFNLTAKNNKDVSSQYPKIYPKKFSEGSQDKDEDDDLFGEAAGDNEAGDPDAANPYDFRHFLSKEKEKRGDESEYHFASSPDYRTSTGSAANTPQFGARRPTAAPVPKTKPAEPVPKKRKNVAPNPLVKPKKGQQAPSVHIERRATDNAPKPKGKAAAPPASKIKSKEIVDSSDDSDMDADGQVASSPPAPRRRSPSPVHEQPSDNEDEDAEGDSDDDGGLEIEVPDERPPRRGKGALASLGLGQNIGGGGYLKSPSHGPMSLASAASSAAGSPNPQAFGSRNGRNAQDEIDFGDLGRDDAEGEEEDEEDYNIRDIEPMDIGPPARQGGHERKASAAGVAVEEDEDDLEKMMIEGLVGGDSSEESEEE